MSFLDDTDELYNLFIQLMRLSFNGRLNLIPRNRLNCLLLGKTGHGKSATGNTALGRAEFESSARSSSVTTSVKCGQVDNGDYRLNIIDTPGLADTSYDQDKASELEKAILNFKEAVGLFPEGIHAFLFVLKFGMRFTAEEANTLTTLRRIFGHDFLKNNGVIIFTHGDAFEYAMEDEDTPDKSFEEWCREQREVTLAGLLQECRYRCVLVNNRQRSQQMSAETVETLIQIVSDFDEPYSESDFRSFDQQRNKLVLEHKVPALKKKFRADINELSFKIRELSWSDSNFLEDSSRIENLICDLRRDVSRTDSDTGLLNDILKEVSSLQRDFQERKRIQTELKKQSDENQCIIM